jgi:hypothetical protein
MAANATTDSPAYVGSITETTYTLEDLTPLETYWWRVDAVIADGTIPGRVWKFRPRRLAFPGADGFGKYSIGGSGGQVLKVTTLEDYDPGNEDPIEGSFRWAATAVEGPRTIVFDVGGDFIVIVLAAVH